MTSATITRHACPGLRPEPLASYLAGLGLIRVIGEQADPAATAAWTPDGLAITTTVNDIAAWLADEYVPTPVLSPWNSGSGFGAKDKEPLRALEALLAHPSPRLDPLKAAIPVARQVAGKARERGWITDGAPGGDKGRVVQEFRNRCPDALLPWIDAAVVLAGEDTVFPPLLGTGGNDGRLDFSTNFHQRLLDVIGAPGSGRARSLAIARDLINGTEAEQLAGAAVGQFDPASAGGPGSSRFGAAESLVNPWGYVLLVEGALLFAASAVRRHQHAAGRAAMPFTVQGSPDGSASGAAGEESRGEVWAPVWTREFTLAEIKQMFAEARASWRGRPARRAVDFYAATRTLGVARGISEFTRYGLQRRNGLAFAAVPLARVDGPRAARGAAGGRSRGLGGPVRRERHVRGCRPGRAGVPGGASGVRPRRGSAAACPAARRADRAGAGGGPQRPGQGRVAGTLRAPGPAIPGRSPASRTPGTAGRGRARVLRHLARARPGRPCPPAPCARSCSPSTRPCTGRQVTAERAVAGRCDGPRLRITALPRVLADVLIWRSRTAPPNAARRSSAASPRSARHPGTCRRPARVRAGAS